MTGGRGDMARVVGASLAIMTILGLQSAAIAGSVSFRLWPFTDYPMYRRAHYAGERLDDYKVFGILADGSEVELTRKTLGFKVWQFERQVLRPMIRQQPTASDWQRLRHTMEWYAATRGITLQALRVENHAYVLTREGMVRAPAVVIGTFHRVLWSAPAP